MGSARVQVPVTFLLRLPAHPPNAPAAHVRKDAFPFIWGIVLLASEKVRVERCYFIKTGTENLESDWEKAEWSSNPGER